MRAECGPNVAHAPDELLAAHVRAHQGELARLVPELRARVADLPAPQIAEAETERYLLFEGAAGLLATASQDAPIVLVLDDLHWAGAPELLLLKHIIRSSLFLGGTGPSTVLRTGVSPVAHRPEAGATSPPRLLIIGTYRDTDLTRTHPLTSMLADLRRESGVERLALRGLDDAAVVALVTASAGHDLTEAGVALAHALHRETEGNPFFITEILRNLTESGAVFREGERWTYKGDIASLGIPEGVRDVIGRRLGRLSEATNKVLSLAAVIGRQFDLALLTRIVDASAPSPRPEEPLPENRRQTRAEGSPSPEERVFGAAGPHAALRLRRRRPRCPGRGAAAAPLPQLTSISLLPPRLVIARIDAERNSLASRISRRMGRPSAVKCAMIDPASSAWSMVSPAVP